MATSRPPPQVSDAHRRELEATIAAALLLIAKGRKLEALAALGQHPPDANLTPEQAAKLQTFAAERAQLIQDGVNQRFQAAIDALPDNAPDEDVQAALDDAGTEIDQYNGGVLLPFMAGTAGTLGLLAAYSDTPGPDGDGSMQDAVKWDWQQNTDYQDDCTEAMDASPASYDELVSITGGPPPVHLGCLCELSPT